MDRRFVVPTLSMISLGMTSGCTPGVVGDWDLTKVTYDGETMEFPMVYTYDEVTYTMSAGLVLDKDETGQFVSSYSYSGPDGSDSESSTYDLTWEKTSGKEYLIKATDADADMHLSCTLDKDVLECTDSDSAQITFAKAE